MAFFMNPGAMFLGCLGTPEQRFLVKLIETAAQSGYTRFVEPCAGTFAMANLAVQNGFRAEQIETSDVNMMSTVLGYAITGQSLEPLEIHAQGFEDSELLTLQPHCMLSYTSVLQRTQAMIISIRCSQIYASDGQNILKASTNR